jgi:hypothetical protein
MTLRSTIVATAAVAVALALIGICSAGSANATRHAPRPPASSHLHCIQEAHGILSKMLACG